MLKGIRCETAKCAMERQGRSNPPGMHSWRRGKATPYAMRLREKQKVKRYYGVLERQFMRYFSQAERLRQNTGIALLCLLERRLDNAVYKAGFAASRRAARQLICHGHFYVNGRRVDRPGYRVRQGDKVTVKPSDRSQKLVREFLEGDGVRTVQPWLQLTPERLEASVVALPTRDDVQIPVEEQLIVELCSR
jgi:small subunit ribosomal protein S4